VIRIKEMLTFVKISGGWLGDENNALLKKAVLLPKSIF
jgi:hypothetical protein